MMKNICPVCEKYEYNFPVGCSDICNECGWEDDGVQRRDPDWKPGANRMSLNEARHAWRTMSMAEYVEWMKNLPRWPYDEEHMSMLQGIRTRYRNRLL